MNELPQGPLTKIFIAQFLPENPVILEAGAHIGRDTIKMANIWPQATIYAFEPVPELFSQLKKSTEDHTNIHVFELALSDTNGQAVLYVSRGASTAASSLLEPYEYTRKRPEVDFTPLMVTTITLDTWAQQHNINRIDFMWLDMQGNELKVLQAAPSILKTVKAILIEVSLTERFKGNPLRNEVFEFMKLSGFIAIQEDKPVHDKINILFKKH